MRVRTVPERPAWAQLVTAFGGFFVGPYSGLRLAAWLAPDSDLVQTASVFAFALVFVGGTLIWMGLGIAVVVVSALSRLLRGRRPGSDSLSATDQIVPPGYGAFVGLGLVFGSTVGLLAGLVTELSIPGALGAWAMAGLAYGVLLWAAARDGYLPFNEPE